jgi:hypothetical protein
MLRPHGWLAAPQAHAAGTRCLTTAQAAPSMVLSAAFVQWCPTKPGVIMRVNNKCVLSGCAEAGVHWCGGHPLQVMLLAHATWVWLKLQAPSMVLSAASVHSVHSNGYEDALST